MSSYLLLEDGGRIILEDGSGFLLLEDGTAPTPDVDATPFQRRYALKAQATYHPDARRTYPRT